MTVTKDDVWGKFDENTRTMVSRGMVVARYNETCPIFGDVVPFKSVTVVCTEEQAEEVIEWLQHVHGGDSVSKEKNLPDGKIAFRSDYQCW